MCNNNNIIITSVEAAESKTEQIPNHTACSIHPSSMSGYSCHLVENLETAISKRISCQMP